MTDKWTVVPGVRWNHNSEVGTEWTPKIAANYRAGEKTKFYASWGRIVNYPSNYQLYYLGRYLSDDYYLRGNPNLPPEKGIAANIGVEHDFSDDVSLAVNLFRNSYYINGNIDSVDDEFSVTNVKVPHKNYGFEIAFHQNLSDKWSYDLAYTYTRRRDHLVLSELYYEGLSAEIPQPNSWRLGLHYKCGKWKANLLGIAAENYLEEYSGVRE